MALLDRLLGRIRRSPQVEQGLPPPLDRSTADEEELDLEEGALDPDELVGDPLVWDEGADDEV